jgi:hypothetical protein
LKHCQQRRQSTPKEIKKRRKWEKAKRKNKVKDGGMLIGWD